MKQLQLLTICLVVLLCLASCGGNNNLAPTAQIKDNNTVESTTDDDINTQNAEKLMEIINSIQNQETKNKLMDLLCTVAYGESSTSDGTDPVEKREPIDLEPWEKMSKLSGDELNKEISKCIEKMIVENIDNTNIKWNKEFVEQYVKVYCPDYYDKLIKKCMQ